MKAVYVPWLHMHQPLVWHDGKLMSNLQKMLHSNDSKELWEAKLMARAYKNPAKHVLELADKGFKPKIMLDFSGLLLQSLKNMKNELKHIDVKGEKIGDIIDLYKKTMDKHPELIEFAGTAYSHCYFPATPEDDWEFQIEEWRKTFKSLFGEKHLERVKGFWLPEMGIPGDKKKLSKLITLLKEHGYEWMILPIEALQGERQLGFEQRVIVTSQPHLIEANNERFPVIFRVRYDFIDQQAGCDANGVYEKGLLASKIFSSVSDKPALIIPASDGENGNVMMNEFFPSTFIPFFTKKIDSNVASMTVSEFLQKYYSSRGKIEPKSTVSITPIGSSWTGSHENWLLGEERLTIKKEIEKLSKEFHSLMSKSRDKNKIEEAKQALLISETSCYVYWGMDYWFDQGRQMIEYTRRKFKI